MGTGASKYTPPCRDACDCNDDGTLDLADTVCILQFLTALLIERRYERGLMRELPWIIWYPLAFWLLSAMTALAGFFKAILRRRRRAVWVSPDRGVRSFVKH